MDQLLRELSRVAFRNRALEDVLGDILKLAVSNIPGAEASSITLIRDEKAFTVAHYGDMALAADEMQYERGRGPCMDAARGGVVIRVDDMRTEQRFGDYGPRVAEQGVLSSLSVPLPYQGTSIGALNNYSRRPAAFASPDAVRAGVEVAQAVATAVLNADSHAQLSEKARNLGFAMESRAVIEQAKGVLMAQRHVDPDRAFEILREASQRYNRKLRDIAVGIVASTHSLRNADHEDADRLHEGDGG